MSVIERHIGSIADDAEARFTGKLLKDWEKASNSFSRVANQWRVLKELFTNPAAYWQRAWETQFRHGR